MFCFIFRFLLIGAGWSSLGRVSLFRERKVCSSNVSLKVIFSFSFLLDFLEIIIHTMDLLKHKPILVMYCNVEWALGNHTVHLLPLHGTLVLLN